jgi:hypothetical protein
VKKNGDEVEEAKRRMKEMMAWIGENGAAMFERLKTDRDFARKVITAAAVVITVLILTAALAGSGDSGRSGVTDSGAEAAEPEQDTLALQPETPAVFVSTKRKAKEEGQTGELSDSGHGETGKGEESGASGRLMDEKEGRKAGTALPPGRSESLEETDPGEKRSIEYDEEGYLAGSLIQLEPLSGDDMDTRCWDRDSRNAHAAYLRYLASVCPEMIFADLSDVPRFLGKSSSGSDTFLKALADTVSQMIGTWVTVTRFEVMGRIEGSDREDNIYRCRMIIQDGEEEKRIKCEVTILQDGECRIRLLEPVWTEPAQEDIGETERTACEPAPEENRTLESESETELEKDLMTEPGEIESGMTGTIEPIAP